MLISASASKKAIEMDTAKIWSYKNVSRKCHNHGQFYFQATTLTDRTVIQMPMKKYYSN